VPSMNCHRDTFTFRIDCMVAAGHLCGVSGRCVSAEPAARAAEPAIDFRLPVGLLKYIDKDAWQNSFR
jgi:hypothetical protein